jgi:uncharacterized protein with HEPN domain
VKDDRLYLIHIQECIARIEDYTRGGRAAFLADGKTQDAVLRNLQTMAESTQRLSAQLRQRHPEVNWRQLAGFRNVLVHDYLGIDVHRVWLAVETDVPDFKNHVAAILKEIGGT